MEKNTNISVYFPPKLDSDPTHFDVASQRRYSFVGEVIYVIVIAEFTGQDKTEDELSAWQKDIEGCTVLTSVTEELSSAVASSEKSDPTLPNEKCSEQTKRKTHGYRNCPVKVCHKVDTTDPLKQTHLNTWQELEKSKLALKCSVTVDVTPFTDRCTVWVAVKSSKISSQNNETLKSLETYLQHHSKNGMEKDGKSIRWLVHANLLVIRPAVLQCKHLGVAGKQYLFLNVSNIHASKLVLHSIRVSSSVVQGTEQQQNLDTGPGDVECSEPIKVDTQSADLPISLVSVESHSIVTEMEIKDLTDMGNNTQNRVVLEATLCWSLSSFYGNQCSHIVTRYSLLELKIRKPGLVIVAEPESQPELRKSFKMKYTITNNLADFLSLNLIWNPEKALKDAKAQVSESYRRNLHGVINSVVCHEPARQLGACSFGSTRSVSLGFQILNPGVFELGQHMKLNLQYSSATPSQKPSERRGSITSTHSMPSDLLTPGHGHKEAMMTQKSSSMCPLSVDEGKDWRRGSTVSLRSLSTLPTPTDLSPLHTASGSHKQSSGDVRSLNTNAGLLAAQKLMKLAPPEEVHTKPSTTTSTTTASTPVHPTAITTRHVLKRNCQVYVVK